MSAGPTRGPMTTRRSVLATLGGCSQCVLAGCSGSGRIWGSANAETITLEYVDVAGERSREIFDPIIDDLNDDYDETIELRFNEIPYENMLSQLQTRVGGGNAPDIAAIDQIWLGTFVEGGALLQLDAVAEDVGTDDFLDPFVAAARFDGHLYAFPTTTDVRGMYWNRSAFEDAGLDPESPPETWRDLLAAAAEIHDPPNQYGAAYFVNAGRYSLSLFGAGGTFLNQSETEPRFQESPGLAAAEFIDTLYNKRDLGPPQPPYQNSAQLAREFLQGRYGITVVEGSWLDYFWRNLDNETKSMTEQFGFGPSPRPAGGETVTMSGGHMWAGFSDTAYPNVVRDFLRKATTREFMRHLSIQAGQIPTRESLQNDPAVWDGILYSEVIRELLAETRVRPVRNWPVVAEALDPALQRVAFGQATPEKALETAARAVRSELQ